MTSLSRHVDCIDPCRVVTQWRESLAKKKQKAAQSLANPAEYENLFPGLQDALKTEQFLKEQYRHPIKASDYPTLTVSVVYPSTVRHSRLDRTHP